MSATFNLTYPNIVTLACVPRGDDWQCLSTFLLATENTLFCIYSVYKYFRLCVWQGYVCMYIHIGGAQGGQQTCISWN